MDKFSRERSATLVLSKEGKIDMDDDGNSIVLKTGVLAGTDSGTSLDQLQVGHGPAPPPPPPHAIANTNTNTNTNTNGHARSRISVDITQCRCEGSGSGDMVEIMLARTVEEDMYAIDVVPLSDTTIVDSDESKYYASASTAGAAAAAATTGDYFGRQHLSGAGAGAGVGADEPYRFDFDALPLPAGMTLPPWQQTLPSGRPKTKTKAGWRTGTGTGTERRIFAPLTKVLSPLITRTQWIIIVRSALIGLILACAVGGASMAIR